MLNSQTGWLIGVGVSLLCGLIVAIRRGAESGLGCAVSCSILFPTWLVWQFGDTVVGVRTVVAGVALGVYASRFPRRIRSPLTGVDACVAALTVIAFASDLFHGSGWFAAIEAYCEWAFPFLAGRFACRRSSSSEVISRWVIALLLVLSAGGIVEALSGVNCWEEIFGLRTDGAPQNVTRFGFERACGNTIHPIFFGLELIALAPWPLSRIRAGLTTAERSIAALTSLAVAAGVIATLSRGPILAMIGIGVIALMIRFIWTRWLFGIAGLAIAALIAANPVLVLTEMGKMIGEKGREIELQGEKVETNSTLSRIWLVRAYMPAFKDAGLLGYGTEAISSFPVNIPKVPASAKTVRELRWVDNEWILMGLRFGWLGLLALAGLFLTVAAVGVRLSSDPPHRAFGLWMASMTASLFIVLFTVWLSYDFGFCFLWMSGAVTGRALARFR
jgi:hypothetical protein